MDLIRVGAKRCLDLNEMEELRNDAYINSKVAKQRMKRWHDQLISNKEFWKGQRVLLYDSRLHIFPRKLKSRWIGPFIIHQVHLNGVVELLNFNSKDTFKVNGHRLKPFIEPFKRNCKEIEGRSWNQEELKSKEKSMVCKISVAQKGPNENGIWLQNDFASLCTPSAKIFANTLGHTSAIS
ncbi:hypothetical protein AAG906_026382 [Vitis piasezkii]